MNRTPIAFLSADCMQASSPNRRADHWEHDLEYTELARGCAEAGLRLDTVIWNRADWNPSDYAAIVVGTTWDYAQQPEAFLLRLRELEQAAPLHNSSALITWNSHKAYLRDLERDGATVVPTLWRAAADEQSLRDAFDALDCEEIVVKPQVGAGAWRQARIRRGDAWPAPEELPPDACMVQPFLPASAEGEYSFVFFGGEFSHCALKVPAQGDYRVQSLYGAKERPHVPSREERRLAQEILGYVPEIPLYARVDMMRDLQGHLALMELELIEPYLYPEQGPGMGTVFARALRGVLGRTRPQGRTS
ncbi:MAG TPA: hypothetical protein P5218_06365 [Planctomycetota bacterium]|nr:hypothetical protein [Planctomycetota bacterium]HRV81036.1 hypothetical protein [Planctomycetota bacterium]